MGHRRTTGDYKRRMVVKSHAEERLRERLVTGSDLVSWTDQELGDFIDERVRGAFASKGYETYWERPVTGPIARRDNDDGKADKTYVVALEMGLDCAEPVFAICRDNDGRTAAHLAYVVVTCLTQSMCDRNIEKGRWRLTEDEAEGKRDDLVQSPFKRALDGVEPSEPEPQTTFKVAPKYLVRWVDRENAQAEEETVISDNELSELVNRLVVKDNVRAEQITIWERSDKRPRVRVELG